MSSASFHQDRGESAAKKDVEPESARHRAVPARVRESALLTAQVEAAVRRATGDRVRNLRVCLEGETLTITGRCATFYCKQLAQQAVLALLSEETLINKVDVY